MCVIFFIGELFGMYPGQQVRTTSKSIVYIVFTIALLARLVHIFEISQAEPYYLNLYVDAKAYDQWGQEIANGDIIGKETFYQDPLYPYFLGLIYSIFGHNLTIVIIIQGIIGAFSALLIFHIGRHLINQYVGIISALLLSFHPPIIFYETLIQKEGISIFLVILSIYLFLVAKASRYYKYFFLGGISIALSALTRGNLLLVIPFIFLWLAFEFRKSSFGFICATVLGLLAVFMPVALRNKFVGGEFVLTTAQAGANFYWGNNEDAKGSFYPPPPFLRTNPKYERTDFAAEAMRIAGKKMTSAEVSRFWFKKGIDFIAEHPVQYSWLQYQKLLLLFNKSEISDNYQYYYYERFSSVLSYSPATYWLISSLGLVGMVVMLKDWRRFSLLYLFIVTYSLSLIIFFVMTRYRLQLTPFLTVFAATSLYWVWAKIFEKRYWLVLYSSVLFVIFVLFTGQDVPSLTALNRHEVLYREGFEYESKGDYDKAENRYLEAIKVSPSSYGAHYGLGEVYMMKKRPYDAINEYLLSLKAMPMSALAHFKLGMAYVEINNADEAIKEFQTSIKVVPGQFPSYYGLAVAYEKKGIQDEATKYWNEYLSRDTSGEWSEMARRRIESVK